MAAISAMAHIAETTQFKIFTTFSFLIKNFGKCKIFNAINTKTIYTVDIVSAETDANFSVTLELTIKPYLLNLISVSTICLKLYKLTKPNIEDTKQKAIVTVKVVLIIVKEILFLSINIILIGSFN